MLYTAKEVADYVAEEDVKFIRLAFCDVFGTPKNISVMPGELERAFSYGISFDASAVRGFGGVEKSDLLLRPDPSTLAVLPWRPSHGRVVRMYCDVYRPDGTPFECDPRGILRRAVAAALESGVECGVGAEFEFYLFKTDANGLPTREPFDRAGYMDIAPDDLGENVRREICLTLEEMGIRPESSHHEEGPGQNEIDFRYSDPLSAADNAMTFRTVVRTAAARNGLWASFEPKPLRGASGSGMHINMSPANPLGTDVFFPFMEGILQNVREITRVLNPVESSYERLGSMKAPLYVTWSPENRSQLVRIPASERERTRIELRSPDGCANPYLAAALLLAAGTDGVKRGLTAREPVTCDLYGAPESVTAPLERLPESLGEAAELFCGSAFVRSVLPEALIRCFM